MILATIAHAFHVDMRFTFFAKLYFAVTAVHRVIESFAHDSCSRVFRSLPHLYTVYDIDFRLSTIFFTFRIFFHTLVTLVYQPNFPNSDFRHYKKRRPYF